MKDAVQSGTSHKPNGLLHLPLSYFAALIGFVISMLIAGMGLVGSEEGLFFRLSNAISGEPVWAPEIIAGLLVGWLAYKRIPSIVAFLSWIMPGVILFWNVISWQRRMSNYDSTWSTFFGSGCGGSECLYELFLTAPFYTAIGYAAGAAIARIRGDSRAEVPLS